MRRGRGIWIVGLPAAALVAAAVGVHASAAAPARTATSASTTDNTYSCRVRRQHYVDLIASATLPPVENRQQPGGLFLTSVQKTRTQGGVSVTVTQVSLSERKNSVRIDTSACRRVKRRIPLKPKGLPGPPIVVTPTLFGHDSERCGTSGRVLVRLRVETTKSIPSHALLAIRNDNAKQRPIAFYNWIPRKVKVYIGNSCASGS